MVRPFGILIMMQTQKSSTKLLKIILELTDKPYQEELQTSFNLYHHPRVLCVLNVIHVGSNMEEKTQHDPTYKIQAFVKIDSKKFFSQAQYIWMDQTPQHETAQPWFNNNNNNNNNNNKVFIRFLASDAASMKPTSLRSASTMKNPWNQNWKVKKEQFCVPCTILKPEMATYARKICY